MRAAKPQLDLGVSWLPVGSKLLGGRIEILRKLGSGAMGAVYEALDRGGPVALKTLHNLNPDELYRLKREFRGLSGVSHPNVVAVHELFAQGHLWFFTMEVVRGRPLDSFWALNATAQQPSARAPFSDVDALLLRHLLRQVIEGVATIHDASLLHRDLKPNNVLVDSAGRVVILDFGLVSDQRPGGVGQTVQSVISGTPGFMAPEQAAGQPACPASDWYAVGVMLYQMLTRTLPHRGSVGAVLRAKQELDVQPACQLLPGIPEDLDALCTRLLSRDPERRPTTQEMRALCRSWGTPRARAHAGTPSRSTSSFVGREEVIARLEGLFEVARAGEPVLALIHAESGMGKTRLLARFIEHLQQAGSAFVLRGRCYEREAVPYKAFDEIFDDLTRILLRLPEDQALQLVPRHAATLTRLFPVLSRVEVFRSAADTTQYRGTDTQVQRQGFAAAREVLCRISDRRPLVLVIDDLQWADADSVRLLSEILAPPDAPSLLIVCSYRAEEKNHPVVRGVLALRHVRSEHIGIGPLCREEAVELALGALPRDEEAGVDRRELAERVATEAQGVPLFVLELARFRQFAREPDKASSLPELIQRRVAELPPEARHLIELACVSGRPLSRNVLRHACDPSVYPAALSTLRAAKLAHFVGDTQHEAIEPYHERVRDAVLATFDGDRAATHHAALARALEAEGCDDPEWLAQHLRGAGELERAQHFVVEAARQAMDALAFNRAAELYELALELREGEPTPPSTVYREFGDALARAGRGAQAADAYLEAARHASRAEALTLEGLAASQWLRVGHLEQAVTLLRAVLARHDLPWPKSVPEAVARLLVNRVRIRLSGLKLTIRTEGEVPRDLLDKLDALYPAQTALGTFDYLRGAVFATLALPLALKAGEPRRLVTALASEAVYSVMLDGVQGVDRAERIRDSIDTVSAKMTDPYGAGVAQLTASLCGYWSGHWNRVAEPARRAEELFGERVAGGTWEAALVRSVRHTVAIHGGDLPALAAEVPSALVDARERCDRYAELDLMRSMVTVHLRDDDSDGALRVLEEIRTLLARFPLVSLFHLVMSANVATYLYAGRVREAQERLRVLWGDCCKVALHHFPLIRLSHVGMQADCLSADQSVRPAQRARELLKLSRDAEREHVAWAPALSRRLEGSAHALRRDDERASRAFERASELYLVSGMPLDAALSRYQQARHAPPLRADELRLDSLRYLAGQGVSCPERWATMVHSMY